MGSNKKYCTGKDLNIGDKFTFKNRETIYIFEGYDSLSECFVGWDNYRYNVVYFEIDKKLEKYEF